jgi:hypothetical protein
VAIKNPTAAKNIRDNYLAENHKTLLVHMLLDRRGNDAKCGQRELLSPPVPLFRTCANLTNGK